MGKKVVVGLDRVKLNRLLFVIVLLTSLFVFEALCVSKAWANTATMIHNSTTLGSTKWGGSWGVATGKYGEFTCATCHGRNTGNIKRVKATITTPDGSNWEGRFSPDVTVYFQSTSGANSFGNDGRAPLTSSSMICEVCHTNDDTQVNGVKWHAYNMSGAGDTTHMNNTDCTDCHKHSDGFKGSAACGACHAGGVTPSSASGAHAMHGADSIALVDGGAACVACHGDNGGAGYSSSTTGTHGNGTVNFVGVTYSAARGVVTGTCLTADCHNVNTKTLQSTAWNSTQLDCDDCHYYAATTTATAALNTAAGRPLSADHGVHFGTGGTFACANCHGVDPLAGDTTHITYNSTLYNSAVAIQDEANVIVTTWDDVNNSCANAACHNPTGGAFSATWGTSNASCALCHGNAPATGSHAKHALNPFSDDTTAEDRTDCANCHTGADTYTYAHLDGASAFETGIADGGTDPNFTCSSACHSTTAGKADTWGGAIGCDSCHGGRKSGDSTIMASVNHTKHLTVTGTTIDCNTCHQAVIPTDTTHASSTGATDGAQITSKATPVQANAEINVATWVDASKTCSNTNCHNPSPGETKSAVWGTSVASCSLCHADTTGDPNSGSHTEHVSAATKTKFNVQATCDNCHTVPGGAAFDHLDGTVSIDYTYSGNQTDFTITTWGSCSTTTCHNDGENTPTAVPSPNWGTASAATDCTICHTAPPSTGDHAAHMSAARVTDGMTCQSCHSGSASNSTTAGGASHLAGGSYDVVAGGNYDVSSPFAVTIAYTQAATSTCTANCHSSNPKAWAIPTSCDGCHGNPPATGAHAIHTTVTLQTTAEDLTDCAVCHTGADSYGYGASGNHQNGTLEVAAAGYNDNVTTGNLVDDTCTSACHASTLTDGFWTDTALNCDSCHGGAASGVPTADAHDVHIAQSMACSDCHTGVETAGTSPLTHNDAEDTTDEGTTLTSRGNGAVNTTGLDAEVSDAAFNAGAGSSFVNGSGTTNNTCSNTDCHDPSNTGLTADWDTGTVGTSCEFCHGYDAAATLKMTSGSHAAHTNQASIYGDNIACTACHTNNGPNTAHTLAGGNTQGVVVVAGTRIDTEYTGEKALPSSGVGTCGVNACHEDGKGNPPASGAYTWGLPLNNTCDTCHAAPPSTGDHGGHWVTARTALGLACVSCHADTAVVANNTTIKSASQHLDDDSFDVLQSGALKLYNGSNVTITYAQGAPSNCTTNCHSANPKNWAPPTDCNACHSYPPTTGAHTKHKDHFIAVEGTNLTNATGTLVWTRAMHTTCGICHDMDGDDVKHKTDGLPSIVPSTSYTFDGGAPSFNTGTQSCSNINCHFKPTPDWAP